MGFGKLLVRFFVICLLGFGVKLFLIFMDWFFVRRFAMVWIISGFGAVTTTIGFFGGNVKLVTETTKFLSSTFYFSFQMFEV